MLRWLSQSNSPEPAAYSSSSSDAATSPKRPRLVASRGAGTLDEQAKVVVGAGLTIATARSLCDSVREALEGGVRSLALDLHQVRRTDAVGLAALLQARQLTDNLGVACTLELSPYLYRRIVSARLVEDLGALPPEAGVDDAPATPDFGGAPPLVVRSGRLTLRQPVVEDLRHFTEWAAYPLVDQMVGSSLLYRCRYLPEDDPEVVAAILHDPRGLTLLVEPVAGAREPIGFVRLYGIDLVSGFGFLETVVAEAGSLRKGFGIDASRLIIAYAHDVMNLRRVEAKAYAYNVLSINALRRNGFQEEGVLRQARVYEGQAWDILVFSLLEPEMARERRGVDFPDFGLWGDR